jgi:hypothetical protein
MKTSRFIQKAFAVGLSTQPIQAKENVFEAVPDGIDAYMYG